MHISSGAAHKPIASWAAYCCSKAALYMLYECFKEEFQDIAFASVMPGIVNTNMQTTIRSSEAMISQDHQFFIDLKSNSKLIECQTVAKFLSWLLLKVKKQELRDKEWDIYDKSHHPCWVSENCVVPSLDEVNDVG